MSARARLIWVCAALAVASSVSFAQDDALEAYLKRHGLTEMLALQLERRTDDAVGQARLGLADRLAGVYVELLESSRSPEEWARWEAKARELLRSTPGADTFELRLRLARALYDNAESSAERWRLRLGGADEAEGVVDALENAKRQFMDLAARLATRVEQLERLEESSGESPELSDALADARRLRSEAFYFAGWSSAYLAELTGSDRHAIDGLTSFGWLLNSGRGRLASIERAPERLFSYEHIARSAVGCAICVQVRGSTLDATRWLDLVAESTLTPQSVKDLAHTRRIGLLGGAQRWAELERFIRLRRADVRNPGRVETRPLSPVDARTLAIVAMENSTEASATIARELATVAIADLIRRDETDQVIDLVTRFGDETLGETGFVPAFVRGVVAYRQARERAPQATAALPPPASSPALRSRYAEAARLLAEALEFLDPNDPDPARRRAALLRGAALLGAGRPGEASTQFEQVASRETDAREREKAMWLAIQSLRGATKDDELLIRRRAALIALFVGEFPESERAAALVLRGAGGLSPSEAIETLLAVPGDSALYAASRRHAASLLYQVYRGANPVDRPFAADKFLAVADEVMERDLAASLDGRNPEGAEIAERAITLARQMLDAQLLAGSERLDDAREALERIMSIARFNGLDVEPILPEFMFRTFQIALAAGDPERAAALLETLRARPDADRFTQAADRALLQRAVNDWRAAGPMAVEGAALVQDLAERVLAHGVSAQLTPSSLMTIRIIAAESAFALWRADQDSAWLERIVEHDSIVLGSQPNLLPALRRLARAHEGLGDLGAALDHWRTMLAGLPAGGGEWFEARYESLRILAEIDADAARVALDQLKALRPSLGPEPWTTRLRELDRRLPAAPPPPETGGDG